jgi:hypothetical protein
LSVRSWCGGFNSESEAVELLTEGWCMEAEIEGKWGLLCRRTKRG